MYFRCSAFYKVVNSKICCYSKVMNVKFVGLGNLLFCVKWANVLKHCILCSEFSRNIISMNGLKRFCETFQNEINMRMF